MNHSQQSRTSPNRFNWAADWDEAVGLWVQASGHTQAVQELACVHPGPDAANRLLLAAHSGQLDCIDAGRVLDGLCRMQVRDGGALHGCPRWYWEEPEPIDTNAAFFTGLSLIVLWLLHRDDLPAPERGVLREYLDHLAVWFDKKAEEDSHFYPNKMLGDLVCAWLLHEIGVARMTRSENELSASMLRASRYWKEHAWGWGEHLSDIYSKVCLTQLSVLLLFSKKLPEHVREAFTGLFQDLLAIEDAFEGGPRVPAIRSYAFQELPESFRWVRREGHFKASVVPLGATLDVSELGPLSFLGPIFHREGWHEWLGSLQPVLMETKQTDLRIPCFGGAVARASVGPHIRIGSVSRFPFMPDAEHFSWGLSWQSMPVAICRPGATWGYLQWSTGEKERIRSHPADSKAVSYLDNALTRAVNPPVVGRTFCHQFGETVVALRIMPAFATAWDFLADRLRVVGEAGQRKIPALPGSEWGNLHLDWPDAKLALLARSLTHPDSAPIHLQNDHCLDWGFHIQRPTLDPIPGPLASLWIFTSLNDPEISSTLPDIEPVAGAPSRPSNASWTLDWPGVFPPVLVDLHAGEPLRLR